MLQENTAFESPGNAGPRRRCTFPAGQWYDQDRHEWVLLLQGAARQRHRVAWTDPAQDTVWLAVHYT